MVPDNLRIDEQLCLSLNRAARSVNALYRPHLERIGLTYSQYSVMLVLWERGMATVGELGETLGLDSGTLSPMLKRLETSGLVEKRRAAGDERVVEVLLTEHGEALRAKAAAIQQHVAEGTGLGREGFLRLRADLEALVDSLTAARHNDEVRMVDGAISA